MPQSLDSADRKLLIGAGVLLVVLVAVSALISPPQITGASQIPSTYSPAWDGAKGAFLLLQELGYDVRRWEQPPTEIGGDGVNDVLILTEPSQSPSDEERSAIQAFLLNGGHVLATGASAGQFLPEPSPFQEGNSTDGETRFKALLPSPLVRGAPEISMAAPKDWRPHTAKQLVVYGDQDTAAVVTYQYGRGQVIWWAADTPLTNGAIRDAGNLAFFLNCVGPRNGRHILWDEYFHGVHGSLWSFFARSPVLWGVAQMALVFLAILVTYSRRQGPVYRPATPSRLSPLEFVETLGDLYDSAHVGAAAVGIAYQRFRFLLTRKLGLPVNVTVPDLAMRASRSLSWEQAPLLRTLTECDHAAQDEGLRVPESVRLVQELFDYSARLEVRRSNAQEGPME